ncbi:hypothetical protein E3Q22_02263 [Wallemia mellicola]|uniref:Uncharacterized protein n=1 Tax=Wallemia mellicola TaxID=1708541 RepID=A0A4T0PQQ9_9BASI|nr:hypothetical protein E3Q22_02263 [Wallemia mellicola]TIB99227.1 hypothetical protein E3Q18_01700 [Wallemia mellicola]TIC02705.1 hypothetical protein E3Q17_01254 [Wallemia mellicola]TIC13390.1 hypothetical protein E3Q14_01286 [Wallemia mellicola]TIC67889.1 hypothetical protein E3Q01_01104 [Wallemia mellicola]
MDSDLTEKQLNKWKKSELVDKAKELNLVFNLKDKKSVLIELIVNNQNASHHDSQDDGSVDDHPKDSSLSPKPQADHDSQSQKKNSPTPTRSHSPHSDTNQTRHLTRSRTPVKPPRSSQKSKSPRNNSSDSQKQRISLPDASDESNDKSRSTARKSTGSRSTSIDINTIKELQKDQEVSKFNYETLKRTLNDVKDDFRGEFHDISAKVSSLLDDRSERENEMQKWKDVFSRMIDEKLKPLNDQMETLQQTLDKVQSSSQSEKTQSVNANIPLLSRTTINQPTPRNKTIERVQTQTQREELSNPSPAPRMLGKHSRPRDSTDSDIVETILLDDDNQESRYDEDEEQPPPKKRFKASANIWGGALSLEPTKSMPDVSNTAMMPTFGPQFNNVAIVNTSNEESLGNGEKDKSVPPPTPPATKTRYGTERDYDNRFAD